MSVRQDSQFCLLSKSGKDKGTLQRDDFIQIEIASSKSTSVRQPSAETRLLTLVYRLFPTAGAGPHIHSINATVLSRA